MQFFKLGTAFYPTVVSLCLSLVFFVVVVCVFVLFCFVFCFSAMPNVVKAVDHFLYDVFGFWPCRVACGILVPRQGIKPMPPALEAWGLNHWTARVVHSSSFLNILLEQSAILNTVDSLFHEKLLSSLGFNILGLPPTSLIIPSRSLYDVSSSTWLNCWHSSQVGLGSSTLLTQNIFFR